MLLYINARWAYVQIILTEVMCMTNTVIGVWRRAFWYTAHHHISIYLKYRLFCNIGPRSVPDDYNRWTP
jgi:hypothetical protein